MCRMRFERCQSSYCPLMFLSRFASRSGRRHLRLGEPVGGGAVHVGSDSGELRCCRELLLSCWSICNPEPLCVCVFQCVVFAGQLNSIASLVTVFYLLAYAAVDLACLALEWASAPNFR